MTDNIGLTIQQKARGLANSMIESRTELKRAAVAKAFGRIKSEIREILLANLNKAITATEEFDIEPLKSTLIGVFQDDELIKVTEDGTVYDIALDIAGDENDFREGIQSARTALGLGRMSKENAAKFWRIFVYQPYREGVDHPYKLRNGMSAAEFSEWAYTRTIDARMAGWHGKAPYWIILENGNAGASGAYPTFSGTYFLRNTIIEAQRILDTELLYVEDDLDNVINREVLDFTNNPDNYTPGDRLDQFIVEGKQYYIYVTKTRRLGVAQRPRV